MRLLLRMTAVLRGGLASGHRRMGRVRRAAFLMFHMAAATVAFVDGILSSSCVTFSVGMVVMQSNFRVPIFPRRGRGGGRTRGE